MKEDKLREMIRKQIKQSLSEQPVRSTVTRNLGRIEKMAAVKMLKRALGPKNANQQAEFVFSLIDKLGLDASAKQKIRMKAQKNLK